MNKVRNCNADVNKGNAVLIKVKYVDQMWQEASMVEWSTPVWTGKQNASEQKLGIGMGCPKISMEVLPLRDEYMGKPDLSWQLWLVKDVKNNKKSFHRNVGSKKKTKENTYSLLNVCDLVTKDVESIFFCNQREFHLCLQLLSDVIIGCMLMILVYFSWGYKLICLFYFCGGGFVCFKFLLSTHVEKQCFQRQSFLVWPFLKAGKWS